MYEFKTEPYQHQQLAYDNSWQTPSYALFMEMGTGKTKVAIDTMGTLFTEGKINTALIIAPKGVYSNWVNKEIPQHLSDNVKVDLLLWQQCQDFGNQLNQVLMTQ